MAETPVPSELLAPCPHCNNRKVDVAWVDWSYSVVCLEPTKPSLAEVFGVGGNGCGAYGPGRETESEAVNAWNARTPQYVTPRNS